MVRGQRHAINRRSFLDISIHNKIQRASSEDYTTWGIKYRPAQLPVYVAKNSLQVRGMNVCLVSLSAANIYRRSGYGTNLRIYAVEDQRQWLHTETAMGARIEEVPGIAGQNRRSLPPKCLSASGYTIHRPRPQTLRKVKNDF